MSSRPRPARRSGTYWTRGRARSRRAAEPPLCASATWELVHGERRDGAWRPIRPSPSSTRCATRIVGDRRMAPILRGPGADPKAAAAAQGTLELVIGVRQPDAVRTDEKGNAP